jgi:hypothetical protein
MGALSLGLGETPVGNPAYRLQIGSVVSRTFSIWLSNFVPFSLVGLVAYAPALAAIGLVSSSGAMTPLAERGLDLLTNFLTILLSGAVTYGVFRHLSGERASLGEVLRVGISRFGAVWVTGIMYGIAVLIGTLLLVVPGIVLAVRYWLAVPAAVIEETGATASLERSSELTEGNRWLIFRVGLVLFFLMIVAMVLIGVVAYTLAAPALDPEAAESVSTPGLVQALTLILLIPVQTLVAVAPVVIYHDLKVGKEGANVTDLLKVFA